MLTSTVSTALARACVDIDGVYARSALAGSFWVSSSNASFSSTFSAFPVAIDSGEKSFVVVWVDEALLSPCAVALLRAVALINMVDGREPFVSHQ